MAVCTRYGKGTMDDILKEKLLLICKAHPKISLDYVFLLSPQNCSKKKLHITKIELHSLLFQKY